MNLKNFLEDCVLEWGYKVSEINSVYEKSLYEAFCLNQHENPPFIKETMSIILNRENKNFVDRFIKSKNYNIKEFIESLYDEPFLETISSTDFSPSQRPENAGHKYYTQGMDDILSDENQEENNKENE